MKEIKKNIFDKVIEEVNMNNDFLVDLEFKETGLDDQDNIFDGLVRFRHHNKELEYLVKIQNNINNTVIGFLTQQRKNVKKPVLLVAEYINNKKAEEFRKKDIQFIDAVGNTYINNYPLFIFIKGNKQDKNNFKNKKINIFEPGGLKLIYILLVDPENIQKPYRDIAEMAGVALGTVAGTIKELERQGYIIKMGYKKRKLLNKKNLFNRWCIEFNERLRPKLLIGRFTGPNDWWKKEMLDPIQAQWGGEIAVNKLMYPLKPVEMIIYTDIEKYKDIIIKNRLRKDHGGEITLFYRFWNFTKIKHPEDIVDLILVYADLMNTGDQRAAEVAKELYEKYIDRRFRED